MSEMTPGRLTRRSWIHRRCGAISPAALLAVCALTLIPASASASIAWGVNPGMAQDASLVSTPYAESAVTGMASLGVTEARFAAPWLMADPGTPGTAPIAQYDWGSYFDKVAALLARHGLRWFPMLLFPPAAYSGNPDGIGGGSPLPQYLPRFAAFAGAFAARYGRGGSFWAENPDLPALPVTDYEIWNEPNLSGVWSTSQRRAPRQYMRMYATARAAIKAVDPEANAVFASMTPSVGARSERLFMRRAVRSRPRQRIDVVGYHPSVIGIGRYGPVQSVFRLLVPFRKELNRLGLGRVPISVTELAFGSEYSRFPDSSTVLSESERAAALLAVVSRLATGMCGVNRVHLLFWGSDQTVTSEAIDAARYVTSVFAIANPDNTPKPIGVALQTLIKRLTSGLAPAPARSRAVTAAAPGARARGRAAAGAARCRVAAH